MSARTTSTYSNSTYSESEKSDRSNSTVSTLSDLSESFKHKKSRNVHSKCDAQRLNINLLVLGVVFGVLLVSVKGEVLPSKLFTKEDILNKYVVLFLIIILIFQMIIEILKYLIK